MIAIHSFTDACDWIQCKSSLFLVFAWIFGLLYAYVPLENTGLRPFVLHGETYYECSYDLDLSSVKRRIFMLVNFTLTFAIPLVVLLIVYVQIMSKNYSNLRLRVSI